MVERLTAQWGENHAVPTKFDLDFAWDMSKKEWQELQCIFDRLAEFEDAEEHRNKGCEYCLQEETMAYGEDSMKRSAYIYLDGNLLTADLYSDSMAVAICFCPMCGKPLKEKHETDII